MGHSGDDAVHKIPHKMRTHWQNWLEILVLFDLKSSIELDYTEIDVILVQCPLSEILFDLIFFFISKMTAHFLIFQYIYTSFYFVDCDYLLTLMLT